MAEYDFWWRQKLKLARFNCKLEAYNARKRDEIAALKGQIEEIATKRSKTRVRSNSLIPLSLVSELPNSPPNPEIKTRA